MNDVIDIQSTATEIRTAEVVATEINCIKRQTQKIMLSSSIEIGRRLAEAKSLVDHGHWGEWLQQNVNYSDRTAQNLIKIFEQYGDKGMDPLFGESPEEFQELSYTQAIALLSIPTLDEREAFVKEHDVQEMSTRELQEAIKARKEAEDEAEKLKISLDCQKDNLENMQNEAKEKLKKEKEKIKQLNHEIETWKEKSENKESEAAVKEAQEKIEQLQQQLQEERKKEAERMEKMQLEIETAKKAASDTDLQVFTADLDAVQHSFNRMIEHIQVIHDPEKRDKFKGAAKKLLDKLRQSL